MVVGQLSQIDGNGSSEPIDIASKIETLEDRFNILQTRIIKELSTKPDITVQELLSQLTRLPLSLRKEYESSIANCFPSMRTETQINELFTAHLNPLTSFIDYGLIEYFIRTFGSDTLKRDMRSYCSEMVIFMKETTIKQLINYFPGQPEVPPKFSLVEAKIGKDASKCTLEQLNIIRRRYCSEVKLSEIVFHLVAVVESNSFIARWLVPSALVNGIIKSTRNVDQSFYQEYNITSLTLDGMWLYLSETEIEAMWLQVSNLKLVHHYHAIHKQILFELKMENTPIDEISQCLMNHYSILQKNTSNILSQAIINYLFPPSGSFIDFEMLSLIVKQFGSNCLRDVMMSYCKYMSGFVKQSTPQHLLDLSPVPSKVDEGFIQAECGIMKEPSECTCDDILNIKNSICTEIDSSRTVFTMYHIRKPQNGSFLVSWVVPAHLSSDLIESVNHINDAFFVRLNIASFSIGNLWVYNPQLVLFGTKLKDKYQQSQGSPSPVEGIPSPTKKIFRLAMIQRERVQRGHIEDRFVRMTIGGRVDDILHAKSPVELEHIFRNILHGGEIILIEGAPGSGKSTLTVHICQRWGKGEIFQQFTVVILVQLRDPAVQRAQTIADLLPVENAAVAQELASELIATNGRGVLWVLDGWDELPPHLQQDSMFHVLIKRMLSECSIIVTSRPISSGDLHPVVSTRIEVLGFTPEEQRQYFTECLKGDTKVLEALLKKITENPVIQSICYLPLNAAFVIHTFNYRGQSLPNTEYEIYLSVILSCIHRHFEREGKDHDLRTELVSFDDLSKNEAVREPFRCLCELAYHGVMKNKVTFSSSDLPQGSNTLSLLQAIESFLQSGKSVFYNFLHLSIQEILSAYYIATWLSDSDQVSQFQQLFNQPRFAAVFQFYAAFTKLKSPGIHEVIDRIVEEKSKPLLLSLLRCLHEAQNPSLCHYVVERLDLHVIDKMQYVIFSLRSSSLFHLDYLSVSFFLSFAGMTIVTDFEYCSIDDLGAKGLSKYLDGSVDHVSKATVICLDISNNHIHEEGASHIARTVNLIEYLDLSCNLIGDTGASAISEAVRETATLKTLILYNCRITSRGGEDLSKALAQNSSLVKLDIGGNNLGDEGISHVADALKHNKQLKELWISYCGMTDKGAASLASALSVNNSLKKLYMGGRDKGTLTENGLSTITQSLANSSEFVKLAVPDGFGSITGHLSREINEARKRNGLQLVKIKGEFCIGCHVVLVHVILKW